jgi:hypothetical protein
VAPGVEQRGTLCSASFALPSLAEETGAGMVVVGSWGGAASNVPSWKASPTPSCTTRIARCSSYARKRSSVTLRCTSPERTGN